MRALGFQDCFLLIRGCQSLGRPEKVGMLVTEYLAVSLLFRICGVELSDVSWTWRGADRAEDKVMFRKKKIFFRS